MIVTAVRPGLDDGERFMQPTSIARNRVVLLAGLVLGLCGVLSTALSPGSVSGEPAARARKADKPAGNRADEVSKRVDAEYADLEALYKHLHSNPELSLKEFRTSARLAKELKQLGFKVTTKFGGTGVVGVYEN